MAVTASSQGLFYLVILLTSLLCILGINGAAINKDGTTVFISNGIESIRSSSPSCILQPQQTKNDLAQLKRVVTTEWFHSPIVFGHELLR